ncbi:potassium transporter Kef [Thermococcus profundus]|uniref:Potassium transporter Kef n=1 Tax=Thermococcus profundus TaxID=49899 RepID=A0A2Z2M836_THEPR|nr:potassium channel family protein [Thermococcus profundus]ASJ02620.1 potassium transporter Kef [Thermococcus profundus]
MCEYVYANGKKCRLKPLEGSKFCPLHVPYEEGESLLGDGIREIKRKKFEERLKAGRSYFEGVYLYDAVVKDFNSEKAIVFKNSHVKTLIIEGSTLKGLIVVNSKIERVIIFETKVEMLFFKGSEIFGLNILRVDFTGHISIRDLEVRYLMINSTRYVRDGEGGEEEAYGEKKGIIGTIELSGLKNVRRIGINTRYPLLRKILEEHGVSVSENRERMVRVVSLILRDVSFDVSPRFKRQVRLAVSGLSGQLVMENLEVFGHVEIRRSRLRSPEFIHVRIESNLILRGSSFIADPSWNITVLPNLPIELIIGGFMIVEDCEFSNPHAAEVFYRLARTSWERSGDFEKADEYYYLEMVAKRKIKSLGRRRGWRKILQRLEVAFEWLFADLTCKYGTDWKRPVIIWIIAVNVLFPILFYATESVEGISGAMGSLDYEYFSIVTATTLGYGDYHPIGVGRAIASLEALFGMFMWAVFLTVFARKYMR